MSVKFAEKILDSMVDENGHCGERGLSHKQFAILAEHLVEGEWIDRGCWTGNKGGRVRFCECYHKGNIGKYHVTLSEYWHFNPRHTVVSIDLRPKEELDAEAAEKERLRKLRDFSKSEWNYEPKKRVDLDLTLVNDYEYEGISYGYYDSGVRHIYTFRDNDGNCYIWKTANTIERWDEESKEHVKAEIGDNVKMRATIKENGEWRGIKQTVLTRCKVAEIVKCG